MITYPTDKLQKVILSGGCEQNGTPTPDNPIDIVCNNGVLKVRHQSGLPIGYKLLSYLKVKNVAIDLGFPTTQDSKIETQFIRTSETNNAYVYKSDQGTNITTNTTFWSSEKGNIRFGNNAVPLNTLATGTYDVIQDKTGVNVNGTFYPYEGGVNDFTSVNNLTLMGSLNYDPLGVSYLKHYTNNVLTCYVLPVQRESDSVYGYYDIVRNQFFTNSKAVITAGSIKTDALIPYTDGTQEVVTDSLGNTASAERLLAVGDYKDTQEVLTGTVSRNVGIKVLDGTEDWFVSTSAISFMYNLLVTDLYAEVSSVTTNRKTPYCTHFKRLTNWVIATPNSRKDIIQALVIDTGTYSGQHIIGLGYGTANNEKLPTFKAWLADQYANGTPVIIVYPLAEPTTEQVTPQPLAGNSVTQTAGSIDNLPIESSTIAELKKRYIGDKEVQRVYIGDNLVWEK